MLKTVRLGRWDMRAILRTQHGIKSGASSTIQNLLNEMVPEKHWFKTDLGRELWRCEKSPFMLCAYNIKDIGPGYDSCIFCGEPDERK